MLTNARRDLNIDKAKPSVSAQCHGDGLLLTGADWPAHAHSPIVGHLFWGVQGGISEDHPQWHRDPRARQHRLARGQGSVSAALCASAVRLTSSAHHLFIPP